MAPWDIIPSYLEQIYLSNNVVITTKEEILNEAPRRLVLLFRTTNTTPASSAKSNANNNGGLVVHDVFCQFCLYSTFLNDFNGSAGKKQSKFLTIYKIHLSH